MSRPNEMCLSVVNIQTLASGCVAQKVVTGELSIGSGNDSDWFIDDISGSVAAFHCSIIVVDGQFCLQDICGKTFMNGASSPLGELQIARLNEDDEVQIGDIAIHVGDSNSIFSSDSLSIDDWLNAQPEQPIPLKNGVSEQSDEVSGSFLDLDTLSAEHELERETLVAEKVSGIIRENCSLAFTPESNSEFEMSSSIDLKINVAEREDMGVHHQIMHENENMTNSIEADSWRQYENSKDNHLLSGPIMLGLGVSLSHHHDVTHLQQLSQEIGHSLQACIKGLIDIHQQVSEGRFGMLNRNLQPIEDNPLRLGLTYEETIRTMYDDTKSPVHLSPPAAIAESLKLIRCHNEAMQYATSEALAHILAAFSPEILRGRFAQYKRDHLDTDDDTWAWQMYRCYYKELTSIRQQGFEKLYWEIFEQSYDRRIREVLRES